MRNAGIAGLGLRRLDLRAKAKHLIENQTFAEILKVELFAQMAERDDREFQPFTLMNTHQANGVLTDDLGDLWLGICLLLRFDEPEETEQALSLEAVELMRE